MELDDNKDFGIRLTEGFWTNCTVHRRDDGVWMVSGLHVPEHMQRMGWGRMTLLRVLSWADEEGHVLSLNPSPFLPGLDEESLIKFYSKYGFEHSGDDRLMYRNPKK